MWDSDIAINLFLSSNLEYMQLSVFQFLSEQLATVPPVEYEDLSEKTVVVIGANHDVGLGFEAAKHFSRMNPGRIILGCRSKERGEAAATSETNLIQSYHSVSHFTYIKNWKQRLATNLSNYGSSTLLEFLQSSILLSDLKRMEVE